MQTRGQAAHKYPLGSKIIAWTLLAALAVGVLFMIANAIAKGDVGRLAMSGLLAASVAWGSYRNAAGAKSR